MRYVTLLTMAAALLAPAPAFAQRTVVRESQRQLGVPYVWGGASRTGFDCSGLVQYVFKREKIQLPRTADRQAAYGTPIDPRQARPGDLLFFHTGGKGREVNHVGVYVGHQRMVHAPRPGSPVREISVAPGSWMANHLVAARHVQRHGYHLARPAVLSRPVTALPEIDAAARAGQPLTIAHF
jgi:cell wall-associated NlpC family hydrolase